MSAEFKEKLFLMLLEKLALALVLAGFGYFLSLRLEAYKATEARYTEASKKGLAALEAVWGTYRTYDAAIRRLTSERPSNDPAAFATDINQAHDARVKFEQTLDENEIWLPLSSISKIRELLSKAVMLTPGLNSTNPATEVGNKDQLANVIHSIKTQLLETSTLK
jgi:hypothetical protein